MNGTGDTAHQDVVWTENDDANGVADLLGFDFSDAASVDRSGLRALINSAFVSHRRLPMLDVIFDRAARLMTTSLRRMTDDNVEAALDDVSSTRFGDFLRSVARPAVIGVARITALDGFALFVADSALILTVVDVLLGGRRTSGVFSDDERGFTPIELGLAHRILTGLVRDLGDAFEPVVTGGFTLDRMETTPRFAAIAQEASVCALAKFRVRLDDMGGRAMLLIPHATLEPVRPRLLQSFIGDPGSAEDDWRKHLSAEVAGVSVELAAVLADQTVALGRLGALTVGDTLAFERSAGSAVELRAGSSVIARGRVGRIGDAIAVKIDTSVGGLAGAA
jgi:flagellar motor switch protein FliM